MNPDLNPIKSPNTGELGKNNIRIALHHSITACPPTVNNDAYDWRKTIEYMNDAVGLEEQNLSETQMDKYVDIVSKEFKKIEDRKLNSEELLVRSSALYENRDFNANAQFGSGPSLRKIDEAIDIALKIEPNKDENGNLNFDAIQETAVDICGSSFKDDVAEALVSRKDEIENMPSETENSANRNSFVSRIKEKTNTLG